MTTWIGSDIHINHRNILQYCPARAMGRPFPVASDKNDKVEVARVDAEISSMVEIMNNKIRDNWNSVVAPDDDIWIIGDYAMGMIDKAPAFIRSMHGRKHLIRGNHDEVLIKRVQEGREGYTDLFNTVRNDYRLKYKTTDTGRKTLINLYHFPVSHWEGMNQGTLMIHGHLHGTPSGNTGRIKDVGIDTNNLFPYKLDDVVNEMLSIEVIRDHHDND